MSKVKTTKLKKNRVRKEWPAAVYFWAFGLAITSYVVARLVLDSWPHPYHWLSGVTGGVTGIPLGWLWYRWRGDVF